MDATALSQKLVERLADLESGQVSDVLDEAGLPFHALDSSLTSLLPGQRFAGRAACARGASLVKAPASPALPANALENIATEGTVLLIETGGYRGGAVLGGFVAFSLQRAGCRGIITDGAVRDADEIRALGLPCVTAAVTPVNGARRWGLREIGTPITLPGQAGMVRVAPGDLVLADGDGIVVVPLQIAETIIEDAEVLKRIEKTIDRELRDGGSRADVFERNPRFTHIRPASWPA